MSDRVKAFALKCVPCWVTSLVDQQTGNPHGETFRIPPQVAVVVFEGESLCARHFADRTRLPQRELVPNDP